MNNERNDEPLADLAADVLRALSEISEAASRQLGERSALGAQALASVNIATEEKALKRFADIDKEKRDSIRKLLVEPAIARIETEDEEGNQRVYFICRATPVSAGPLLASYRAPIGRLASLPIGSEFRLPNGHSVEITARSQLHPQAGGSGWDSFDTIVEAENHDPLTVSSLRALLEHIHAQEPDSDDVASQLLKEELERAIVFEGRRRSVIRKMELRDQPLLDRYQDEIFRLPLNSRLVLLGPPGTGKTTTLIHRLGQKVDVFHLDEDEQRLVAAASSGADDHAKNWIMFAPTDLLKQYLKEAFAREGIAAPDQRIQTWSEYRRELGRNTFGFLRTAAGRGPFVLTERSDLLSAETIDNSIDWFCDFDAWQQTVFVDDLVSAAGVLAEQHQRGEVSALGASLLRVLGSLEQGLPAPMLEALFRESSTAQSLLTGIRKVTDEKLDKTINLQLNKNRQLLDEIIAFIEHQDRGPEIDSDDQEDADSEDEEETQAPMIGRAGALQAFRRVLRLQARAAASGRSIDRRTRNGRLIEWLGERKLAEDQARDIGAELLVQASIRRFVNPLRRYLSGLPQRYRSFRRLRRREGTWYGEGEFGSRDLHPLELDLLLLAGLRAASELMRRPDVLRNVDDGAWSPLSDMAKRYRNQVLVDEATDFSPVQLACMASLARPGIRSFFACGDFNQRLTSWGAKRVDDLTWVFADIDIREVTVGYRQSRQLASLAQGIIEATGGVSPTMSLPEQVDNEGPPPALLEGASASDQLTAWLSERIREIESAVPQLPSIAVFVNSEEAVQPLAAALDAALAPYNIRAIPCPDGRVIGNDADVRVFHVEHIKGLEFEAVFFVGVDRLASSLPSLFGKYLYVGVTRAATYLGMTCEGALPGPIEVLRPHFTEDWSLAL